MKTHNQKYKHTFASLAGNQKLDAISAMLRRCRRTGLSRVSKLIAILTLAVLSANTVWATEAPSSIRPIEDWVSTQGTFCIDNGMGGCFLFLPPTPNYLGFSDTKNNIAISIDYAGLANSWIVSQGGTSLGTITSGVVIERPLPDGRAEVQVLLHTKNALTFVIQGTDFISPGPLLFGHFAPDVLAGADASLGESVFQLVFINTAPGSPLPDLAQLAFAPNSGQELISFAIRARADGTLRAAFGVPDGTPGRAETSQTGLLFRGPFMGATADGFPAETIELRAVGK